MKGLLQTRLNIYKEKYILIEESFFQTILTIKNSLRGYFT